MRFLVRFMHQRRYLIASLILKEVDGGTFRLSNFWERRACRILPALSAVVLATLAVGWVVLLPTDFAALGESVTA
ncbi:MAG: peptidoglycan/LPS O-acetylase OafA/YrhL [Myxococcota bacterium]|jgi:peptidoglycan/LPS O-acetylase OafA/YrhL